MLLALLVSIALYGVRCLKNVWYFEITRVKDILIYGCIVYLMNKDFATFTSHYTVYLDIAVSILSALIAILSVYVILKLSKLRVFLSFENYELVSIIYLIVFFIGLESASGALTVMSLPYVLAIILNTYSLYVLSLCNNSKVCEADFGYLNKTRSAPAGI